MHEPAELFVWDGAGERQLTNFNKGLLSQIDFVAPERFQFKASDGQMIEGWIMKPRDLKEAEKRPTILDIHGGPKSKYGASLMFELQLYRAEGYVGIFTNPRGSDGYSEKFADIRQAYGTRDYKDIMEAVDYVTTNYGNWWSRSQPLP